MKRQTALILTLVMLCALLSGCVCETAEIRLAEGGSGTITACFGFSEAAAERMDLYEELDDAGFETFWNGSSYYVGDEVTQNFDSPEAFNELFAALSARAKSVSEAVNIGTLTLSCDDSGELTVTLICDGNTGNRDAMLDALCEEINGISSSEGELLLDDAIMTYRFTFPREVYQLSGGSTGVTVADGAVEIDLLSCGAGVYRFSTKEEVEEEATYTVPTIAPTNIPASGTVKARTQTVELDGTKVTLSTYAVVGTDGGEINYVKLRDIAYLLSTTAARFSVDWDGEVLLTPHSSYIANGTELRSPFTGDQKYTRVDNPTKVYGIPVSMSAILLSDKTGGYTYYKLRDLGQALGFNVGWTEARGIYLESAKAYIG